MNNVLMLLSVLNSTVKTGNNKIECANEVLKELYKMKADKKNVSFYVRFFIVNRAIKLQNRLIRKLEKDIKK